LLLNTCLTVEEGLPASHAKLGWEVLTDALISLVAKTNKNVVFMLWGAHAQAKRGLLQGNRVADIDMGHLVLCANHPSPLSALRLPTPFLGCKHFALANDFLLRHGLVTIEW
jgi:uracil-DNA glycosylase